MYVLRHREFDLYVSRIKSTGLLVDGYSLSLKGKALILDIFEVNSFLNAVSNYKDFEKVSLSSKDLKIKEELI